MGRSSAAKPILDVDGDPIPVAVKASGPDAPARIVKRVQRATPEQASAKERALAGTYRVIHGSIVVPRQPKDRLLADGTINPHEPTVEYAMPGDEIQLGDEDAARMLDANIIEELNARPSRVGKVWQTPKVTNNVYGL